MTTNFDSKSNTSPLMITTTDHTTTPSKESITTKSSRNRSRSRSHERAYESSNVPLSPSQQSSSGRSRAQKPKAEKDFSQLLKDLLRQIKRRDAQHFFLYPVTDDIAPGYSSLISSPMDMTTIAWKIEQLSLPSSSSSSSPKYLSLGDFIEDVKLICDNAMRYNRPETIYYKAAKKLWHFTSRLTKKAAMVGYAKTYTKCTPSQLSLSPFGYLAVSQTLYPQQLCQPQQLQSTSAVKSQAIVAGNNNSNSNNNNNFTISSPVPPPFRADFTTNTQASNSLLFGLPTTTTSLAARESVKSTVFAGSSSNVLTSASYDLDDPFASMDLLSTLSPFRLDDEEEEMMASAAQHNLPSDFSHLRKFFLTISFYFKSEAELFYFISSI